MEWQQIEQIQSRRAFLIKEMKAAKAINDKDRMKLIKLEIENIDKEAQEIAEKNGYIIR